jgi:hypothetical protein
MSDVAVEAMEASLKDFQQKLYKLHDKNRAIAKGHTALFKATDGVVELPYNPTNIWDWVTVGKYEYVDRPTEDNPENQEYEYVVDIDASLQSCLLSPSSLPSLIWWTAWRRSTAMKVQVIITLRTVCCQDHLQCEA